MKQNIKLKFDSNAFNLKKKIIELEREREKQRER